jgi:UDPglucose 6-dehydrogenase
MANNFLTVKIAFMNEYYDLVEKIGGDWNQIVEGFAADPRIGNSHTQVPGHDGKKGFGGTCFPKDINAIIEFSKNNNVEMNTLEAAWKTNLRVRPEQDWKQLKGRAVS